MAGRWLPGTTAGLAVLMLLALAALGPAAIGNQKDCRAADQFDLPKTRR